MCRRNFSVGYPWMFKDDSLKNNTFPWSPALEERQKLLKKDLKINLKEYVDSKFNETLELVPKLEGDSEIDEQKRNLSYLNLYWFGKTLIDRSERMGMCNNFEIRMPFCDYKLIEYVWNIPWEMKAYEGREKGLLRHIMKGFLPEEIVERKKSPYPKTHNPNYLKAVKSLLTDITADIYSPIHNLIDKRYVINLINTDGKIFTKPWYGQLMTGPQLMAYLISLNFWMKKYEIEIDL